MAKKEGPAKMKTDKNLKRMFVIGAYGCGNCGDDAILQSIREYFPDWSIRATNGTFQNVSEYIDVKPIQCRLNEGFSIPVLFSMLLDSFKMLASVIWCDVLLYGGGSLIHDLTKYNLPFMFLWQFFAKLFKKKVYYFSIGVGPISTRRGKKQCKKHLAKADGVFVRDDRGFRICKELGLNNVVETADAAIPFHHADQCNKETLKMLGLTESKYICVTGSQWFESTNFWQKEKIDFSDQIRHFAKCVSVAASVWQVPIVFVPTVMHDQILGRQLQPLLKDIDFRLMEQKKWNCCETAEVIENSSFLLGVRMHSIIFAIRQKVPVIALIYDQKVSELMKRMGLQQYVLPIQETDLQELKVMINTAKENEKRIFETVDKKIKVINDLIEESVCVVEKFRGGYKYVIYFIHYNCAVLHLFTLIYAAASGERRLAA